MSTERLSFGPVRTSTSADADTSSRRPQLTSRGDLAVAAAVVAALFLLMWLASALAYAATGISG